MGVLFHVIEVMMIVMAILRRFSMSSHKLQVAPVVFLTSILVMAVINWGVRVFWVFKHVLRMHLIELRLIDSH